MLKALKTNTFEDGDGLGFEDNGDELSGLMLSLIGKIKPQ